MSHAERLLKIAKEVFVETSLLSTLHIAYFFVFFAVGCLVFRFAYKTHWSNLAGKVLPAGIYRNPQLLLDVKMVLLNRFISSFIVIYLGFSLFEFFQPIRSQSVGFFESIFSRPAALTSENIMINLLWSFSSAFARDFNRAYVHYLFHNIPFFWQFHKVHHSAQTLTPFSNFRQHPVDWYLTNVSQAVLHSVLFAAFYFFFGEHFNFYLFAGVSALGVFIKVLWPFKHSHIWISYGPLSYIFSSPAMHQIHHSLDPTHKNKNFANTFSVIDWMFGTLYVPSQEEHFPIGALEHDRDHQIDSLRGLFFSPFGSLIKAASAGHYPEPDQITHETINKWHCRCGPNCEVLKQRFEKASAHPGTKPDIIGSLQNQPDHQDTEAHPIVS